MSWTSELAAAETAEQTYRATRKGSQNCYLRFDARGGILLTDWVRARAAASSVKVPASDASFWANVASRAVTNMGAGWLIVQNQLGTLPAPFMPINYDRAPFGFPGGTLDGLFGGLVSKWASDVFVANGRTLPAADFPIMEDMTYLFGNTLQLAGAT
jgi:hypothetical protein